MSIVDDAAPRFTEVHARPKANQSDFFRLIGIVFLPFVAGYYISYLFRTINALIAPDLVREISMSAGTLGLMTSVYFLTFAAVQLPLGVAVDRFGPRRVQGGLLMIAAAGAALFAIGGDAATLVIGRALIGLGVAGALMAGLKALALWFPKERLALINGCYIMLGTAGAITATAPAEALLGLVGWRELFLILAVATVLVAVAILGLVPEKAPPASDGRRAGMGLRGIFAERAFWRLMPLSASCVGSAWAMQGLWVAPWLSDVAMLDRSAVIAHLFTMACALCCGALALGIVADWLRRLGIGASATFIGAASIFIVVEAAILLGLPLPSLLLWGAFAVFGAMTVLSFTILATLFPVECVGRANAALNVFHVGGAFLLQYTIGAIVALWPEADGRYPAAAYESALTVVVSIQLVALLWYLCPLARPQRGPAIA